LTAWSRVPQGQYLDYQDDAYNEQRLLRIIGSLTCKGSSKTLAVIPLKLAFADDLAQQIEKIMTPARIRCTVAAAPFYFAQGMGVVAPSAQGGTTKLQRRARRAH